MILLQRNLLLLYPRSKIERKLLKSLKNNFKGRDNNISPHFFIMWKRRKIMSVAGAYIDYYNTNSVELSYFLQKQEMLM